MSIKYEKISLFDAPVGSIIIHACNAKGVWGSGIAKEFKTRYPGSYELYHETCVMYRSIGHGRLSHWPKEESHYVGWIITSRDYGPKKDSKISILANTALALDDLCEDIYTYRRLNEIDSIQVYSNKFNSGLFGVPWEESEEVLKQVLERYPHINWIVCDPNMKVDDWS